jgi:hypothetical protein
VGEEARVGSGNFEADSRGFVLDFLRGGVSCFSCSSDDGSSSSIMPGTLGGRAMRPNWGDAGFGSMLGGGRRARGDGGLGGVVTVCLILWNSRR